MLRKGRVISMQKIWLTTNTTIVSIDEILGIKLKYRDDKISQLGRLNGRFVTVFNDLSNKVIFGELCPDVLEYLAKYAGLKYKV